MKTLLLSSLLISITLCAFAQTPQQQQTSTSGKNDPLIECRLTRQDDGMFAGKCLQPGGVGIPGTVGAGETFQIRLVPPVANEPNLWRGTVGSDKNGQVQRTADSFQFSFNPALTIAPTKDDVEILRRARKYLDDPAHWSHQPDADVYTAATAFANDPILSRRGFCPGTGPRTLCCALYHASIEQTGEFWWGRPAVNAVRAAVLADDSYNQQHPLMQFNGEADRKLSDVLRVFDVAIAYTKERQNCGIQTWVWGAPISKKCQ
jgi:hypothetical protein